MPLAEMERGIVTGALTLTSPPNYSDVLTEVDTCDVYIAQIRNDAFYILCAMVDYTALDQGDFTLGFAEA
jgi:hypothetical protein